MQNNKFCENCFFFSTDRLDDPDQIESYVHNILWYESTTDLSGKRNFLHNFSLCFFSTDRLDDPDQIESYVHNILWYESTTDVNGKDFATTEPAHLPFFEDTTETANVTVQFGVTVLLECRVNDLLDKTVSLKPSLDKSI
ncbi:hypothetical protein M8J75_008186 [Diaphorina citri]|nr:hypothetical protein M8J75_008186 [Diaphorina citri]